MSGRTTKDYRKVLRAVLNSLPEDIKGEKVVLDFERATWKALREVLPDVSLQGCVFHWTQAVWRKVQEIGLQAAYINDDANMKFIRRLLALPFLPYEHITDMFSKLEERASTEPLRNLCTYIRNKWITSTTWSVYMCSVRTNNDCDGWHRRLNRHAKKNSLPFYLLMKLLHEEAQLVSIEVRLVKEGKLQRYQRRRYKLNATIHYNMCSLSMKCNKNYRLPFYDHG